MSSSRGLASRLTKRQDIIFTCPIISGNGCREESSENEIYLYKRLARNSTFLVDIYILKQS
jgi:hypothetical protein